jgi:two-component system chemotaxis sensor kinase CheA
VAKDGSIDQFRRGFQEEARELLVELEMVLLQLNERREDGELVGRVFRALHTIKGSGSMFGFDELAAFAHKLENAFDEVRKGRLAVTPELVDLTLSALDQIREMVEEGEGETAEDGGARAEILANYARSREALRKRTPAQPGKRQSRSRKREPERCQKRARNGRGGSALHPAPS